MKFNQTPAQEYDFGIDRSKLDYKEKTLKIIFILPKGIIQEKVDRIQSSLFATINQIIITFCIITVVMMLIGSYFLNKVAYDVTSPIVELTEKILDIMRFRYEEKQGVT